MLYLIVGKPGEGKSLTSSIQIRERLEQGIKVFTNLHLNEISPLYNYFETDDWRVILEAQDGEIWFDEGQFILDARRWDELPVSFRQLLQKGRHEGLDFYVLTQSIMQIDVAYRRLIHEAYRVKRLISWKPLNIGLFLTYELDVSALVREEREVATSTFWWLNFVLATKRHWEYYNSFALRSQKPPLDRVVCTCGVIHRVIHRSNG